MRLRPALLLLLVVPPSCTQSAIFIGSATIEGINAPDPMRLHWSVADDGRAKLEPHTVAVMREGTMLVDGRLQFEFRADPGPIDVAFWYDVNGNEVLDTGDKTGRLNERVKGRDIGLGCLPLKTIIPPTHLAQTFDEPAPATTAQTDAP